MVFLQGGQVRTDAEKEDGTVLGAEAAGDFPLNFSDPEVPLRLDVAPKDERTLQEAQRFEQRIAEPVSAVIGSVSFRRPQVWPGRSPAALSSRTWCSLQTAWWLGNAK